jgi:hypothetical protein
MEERMMRKLVYALTAAAAIAAGIPTLANAGEVYIQGGDYGYYHRHDGPRFGFREHERDREFRHGFDRRDYGERYGDRDFVVREHRDYY